MSLTNRGFALLLSCLLVTQWRCRSYDDGAVPRGGQAGMAGSDQSGSSGAATVSPPLATEEETIVPLCITTDQHPAVALASARGLAAGLTYDRRRFAAFASKATGNTVLLKWQYIAEPEIWVPWSCFDMIKGPDRLAAVNLPNGELEVFVSTQYGRLFVRRQFGQTWGHWTTFTTPWPDSNVTDVAATAERGRSSHVYVIDRGRVLVRYRTTMDSFAPYSGWGDLGTPSGRRLAAGLKADGRQQVFAITDAGNLVSTTEANAAAPGAFEGWEDFESPPGDRVNFDAEAALVDVECGYGKDSQLIVFAIDGSGAIWSRAEAPGEEWSDWTAVAPPPSVRLVSLATAYMPLAEGAPSIIVGLSDIGLVYYTERAADAWMPWQPLP